MGIHFSPIIEVNREMTLFSYAYIEQKALRFLTKGYEAYTNEDAFKRPGNDLPPEVVSMLVSGCEQVRDLKGLNKDQPFEGLGVGGFYHLMRMFHFIPVHQEISSFENGFIIDRIIFEHQVSGEIQRVELFNKVKKSR